MIKKSKFPKVLPALIVLTIVATASLFVFSAVKSFVGNPKVVVEGDYIEAAGQAGESDVLGGESNVFGGAGHVVLNRTQFAGGLITSALGGDVTSFTSGSVTFSANDICDNKIITQNNIGAPASAQTNTFPTAASLISTCLLDRGDSRTVRFDSIAQAGETFTFALGTGIDVFVASGSAVVAGKGQGAVLHPEAAALVTFTNMNGTSVSADFLELINAD